MSSQDFLHSISDALQDNPFLDGDGEGGDDELSAKLAGMVAETPLQTAPTDEPAAEPAPADNDNDTDNDRSASGDDAPADIGSSAEDWGTSAGSDSATLTALDLTQATVTLAAHLHSQLALMRLSPRELALARLVVELLDDDGYLRQDPIETLALLDGEDDLEAGAADVEIAVRRVQSLEPAGVGARSVQECLQLQCEQIVCPALRARALAVVTGYLPQLAQNDLAAIGRALRCTPEDVDAARAAIRRFAPRPGWRHGGGAAPYVTPDVVVQRHKGRWRVLLNPAVVPRVRLNRQVVDLFRKGRTAQHRGLTGHLQEAHWMLRNVEQRFCTIVAVAQAIVDRQGLFLEHGELAMKPLALAEVAAVVGVHESTVSRVTSNKYMTTPAGTFELKRFFSRAFMMPSGTAYSAIAIRRLVRELIEAERPGQPLSDAELAAQLKQQGFPLARRTVTKYRQEMRIAPAAQRRPLTAA